jgi:hypothetical protein
VGSALDSVAWLASPRAEINAFSELPTVGTDRRVARHDSRANVFILEHAKRIRTIYDL